MNSEIRSHLFSLSPNAFQICKGPPQKISPEALHN